MTTPRAILALLLLLLVACAPDAGAPPNGGPGGHARLEVVGAATVQVEAGSRAEIGFRYLDASDEIVPGAVIDFAIAGDAMGADLAAMSASTDDEWLTLSTIHSAKGLEWARVWVLSAVTGRFPSIYALDEEDGMEEERRLLYVAVTRAKRRVELLQPMSANGRSLGGDNPFLDELPRDAKVVEHRWWRPVAEPLPDAPGLTDAKDRMARFLAFYGGRPK